MAAIILSVAELQSKKESVTSSNDDDDDAYEGDNTGIIDDVGQDLDGDAGDGWREDADADNGKRL